MKYEFTFPPCEDAGIWLDAQPDAKTAWAMCDRGDWMWWALQHSKKSMPSKVISISFAEWCEKRARKYNVYAAAYAVIAAAAADAVIAAAAASDAAADAVIAAAAAAYAVANAASDAAADAVIAAAAVYAADVRELKLQARWIRKHCKWKG